VDEIALLLYTSGTTGSPKGVLHPHGTLIYEVDSLVGLARLDASDHIFMPSPLTHITGVLAGTLMSVRLRIPLTLLDRWDPAVAVDLIEREQCTFTVSASPFLHGMTSIHESRGAPSSLQVFLCGGADVPPDLVRRARAAMGTGVVRVYGSTEMPTFSAGDPFGDPELAAMTDGLPIGPVEGKLVNVAGGVGELAVRGPELFVGYLDPKANEGAFTPDGFFLTGDAASFGDDGSVTIRGRIKDIIIRGGENLSAQEIENVLFEHPAIEQVAVVGCPDPILGERPWAFIVPAAGAEVELGDLQAHLLGRGLAKQKWPEGVELVDDLPKTLSGKVKKFELRERLRS
jgi:cyclohexanecarboxylate-CoA ligase